jgi:hypothetical protein
LNIVAVHRRHRLPIVEVHVAANYAIPVRGRFEAAVASSPQILCAAMAVRSIIAALERKYDESVAVDGYRPGARVRVGLQ